MDFQILYIFVEGSDDERFFERIIKPELSKAYDWVRIVRYAAMKKEKIKGFLRSIKSMSADYIYSADINTSPCVTDKKSAVKSKLKNIDNDKIAVVIKEIESWYLAGLKNHDAKKFKIKPFNNTEKMTKEYFDGLIPRRYDSRIDIMLEILKIYSIETAKNKNKSFSYFVKKFMT